MIENDFEIKQYRIEWVVEVYEIDQYGRRNMNIAPTYSKGWATREQARLDLEAISVPHECIEGRRVAKMAHNHYHDVSIFYREVLIDNPTDTQPSGTIGWRLVPVQPTHRMLTQMLCGSATPEANYTDFWERRYQAMLESAPKFGEDL